MSPDQPLSQGFQIVNFIVKYISLFISLKSDQSIERSE